MLRIPIIDFIRSGYGLVPLLWLMCIWEMHPYFGQHYSPDSYYYYLLGRSVVSGHGYMTSVIRENLAEANFYSRSYPPLMPLLCGLTDRIWGTRLASGMIVDLLALYGILHMSYLIGRELLPRFYGLLSFLCAWVVIAYGPFAEEIVAGRAIPVAALFFMVLLYLASRADISSRHCVAIGFCAGLAYLTRFDVSLFLVLLPPVLCFARGEKLRQAVWMYAGTLLAIAPWMVRNLVTFGHPFVSSNGVAVTSVYDSDMPTLLFFRNGIPSGLDYPKLWLLQRLSFLWRDMGVFCTLLTPSSTLLLSCLGSLAVLGLCIAALKKQRVGMGIFTFAVISLLWLVTDLATLAITRLPDERYFSIATLLITLCAALCAIRLWFRPATPAASYGVLLPALLAAMAIGGTFYILSLGTLQEDNMRDVMEDAFHTFKPFIKDGELVGDELYADNFAYYTGWNMIYLPANVASPTDPDFKAWRRHFHVGHVIVMDQSPFIHYPEARVIARTEHFVLLEVQE